MRHVLGAGESQVLADLCELLVPGCGAIGPEHYIGRLAEAMPQREEDELRATIGLLSAVSRQGAEGLASLAASTAFGLVRRLAIEAYYGDFAAPGHTGPTGHEEIGFTTPQTRRLRKDWSFLSEREDERADPEPVPDEAEVVVVGSGAGGGLIAAELGARGRDVLLLEAGGLHPAEDHSRFELEARHRLWWPARSVQTGDEPVALLAGRCVGGGTVINTKVAMRAFASDLERFGELTGLEPAEAELDPWYELVERALGVRERSDWTPSVHRVRRGFEALGASLQPVRSYTDHNCSRCGACLQGCPARGTLVM